MNDALQAAEDAARDILWEAIGQYTVRDTFVGELLVSYRDAIIARRDAEVAALVEAAKEVVVLQHAGSFGSNVTPQVNALIAARARRFGAALKPFTKEARQ